MIIVRYISVRLKYSLPERKGSQFVSVCNELVPGHSIIPLITRPRIYYNC